MRKENSYHYDKFSVPFSCNFTTSYKAGNVDFHMHNSHEIYLLMDGHIQYFVEDICYDMEPGSLILFSDREIHKAVNTAEAEFTRLVIHVNSSFVRPYCTPDTNLLNCFHREPGIGNLILLSNEEYTSLISMAQTLCNAMKNRRSFGSDLTATTTLLQILIFVNSIWNKTSFSEASPKPHKAQAIMSYIDKNLTKPMTLDSISQDLSLDKYYISHLFKYETESSIFQYIVVKRVALAKELLLRGHTVAEACYLSGFHDYSNFIRTFRKTTGYTPGQFKHMN